MSYAGIDSIVVNLKDKKYPNFSLLAVRRVIFTLYLNASKLNTVVIAFVQLNLKLMKKIEKAFLWMALFTTFIGSCLQNMFENKLV